MLFNLDSNDIIIYLLLKSYEATSRASSLVIIEIYGMMIRER